MIAAGDLLPLRTLPEVVIPSMSGANVSSPTSCSCSTANPVLPSPSTCSVTNH